MITETPLRDMRVGSGVDIQKRMRDYYSHPECNPSTPNGEIAKLCENLYFPFKNPRRFQIKKRMPLLKNCPCFFIIGTVAVISVG